MLRNHKPQNNIIQQTEIYLPVAIRIDHANHVIDLFVSHASLPEKLHHHPQLVWRDEPVTVVVENSIIKYLSYLSWKWYSDIKFQISSIS